MSPDPWQDPEIVAVTGVVQLSEATTTYLSGETALTEKWNKNEWQTWGEEAFGSDDVGGYIGGLTASQRKLLRSALLHAAGPGHNGQVEFRVRSTGYHLHGLGLEIVDGTVLEEQTIRPLMVIFAYEEPSTGG